MSGKKVLRRIMASCPGPIPRTGQHIHAEEGHDTFGYSASENSAENSLIRWDFIGDDMSLDGVTPNQAKAYFNGIGDADIDKHLFLDFATRAGDLKADYDANGKAIAYSKMDKVLALIDSLDLSDEQKDALALQYGADGKGYAEKNLSRAPWRKDDEGKDKKKSGGKRGGGGGRRIRDGRGRGGRLGSGLASAGSGVRSADFDGILKGWKKRKYTRSQILEMMRKGLITRGEAMEILAQTQGEETAEPATDGSLKLGAADEQKES